MGDNFNNSMNNHHNNGNSPMKWYYIGKQDEQEHGPFSSSEMNAWFQTNYFHEELRVKTDQDQCYYKLSEWFQACRGQNPFQMPMVSMQSLQLTNHMNDLNMQQQQPQRVPSVPMVNSNGCGYSLNGTPCSTPNTNSIGVEPHQQQRPQSGMPPIAMQHPMMRPSPMPVFGQQQRYMLINGAPQPTTAPTIYRPPLPGQPVFSPPAQQMPMVSLQQYLQQQRGGQMVNAMPPPFPPSPNMMHPAHHQQLVTTNSVGIVTEQHDANGASDSPDSGHVVTPSYAHHKGVSTLDAPWNDMVERKCGPDLPITSDAGIQTEPEHVELSKAEAEQCLSKLLGKAVIIMGQ